MVLLKLFKELTGKHEVGTLNAATQKQQDNANVTVLCLDANWEVIHGCLNIVSRCYCPQMDPNIETRLECTEILYEYVYMPFKIMKSELMEIRILILICTIFLIFESTYIYIKFYF